jgi:hypothetical protein
VWYELSRIEGWEGKRKNLQPRMDADTRGILRSRVAGVNRPSERMIAGEMHDEIRV